MATAEDMYQSARITYPISSLHYLNTKHLWPIKVRVTQKTCKLGEPKFMSLNFIDQSKGEIQVVARTSDVVDQFFNVFEVNRCYLISAALVKELDLPNNLKHDSILQLTNSTVVIKSETDDRSIPHPGFNFVPLESVITKDHGNFVDLFTLARFTGPPTTGLTSGRSGTQREYKKLQLVLFDDASNIAIKLTAWDNFVDDFNRYSDEERISVAIRGAKVVIHDRIISLETISTTIFKINEQLRNVPEIYSNLIRSRTVGNIDRGTHASPSTSHDSPNHAAINRTYELKSLHDALESYTFRLNCFKVKAFITRVYRCNPLYESCPLDVCRKKLRKLEKEKYYCPNCNSAYSSSFWRFKLQFDLMDFSGSQKVTCFQEGTDALLDKPTILLLRLFWLWSNVEEFWTLLESRLMFTQFYFTLKYGPRTQTDEHERNVTVKSARSVNHVALSMAIIHDLSFERRNPMLPIPSSPRRPESSATARKRPSPGNLSNNTMPIFRYSQPTAPFRRKLF